MDALPPGSFLPGPPGKMAEVSHRLATGAHRLSALVHNRCPRASVFPVGRDPVHTPSCGPSRGLSAPGRATGSPGGLSVHTTPIYVSPPGVPPVGRVTKGAAEGYRVVLLAGAGPCEVFSTPQQLRKFSTIRLTAAGGRRRDGIACNTPGPQQVKHPLHILELWSIARAYSSANSKEAAPLYRSRTAYYDILNASPNATQSQIKTAYYKQSFIFHPDKNPGSEEAARRFSEVSEAYSVLGNVNLRQKYDRGMLSLSDIRNPGRPSSGDQGQRGPQHQQQQARHKASQQQFSRHRGKTMFDFDAFYQAHYGEQLERERLARARKAWHEARGKQRLRDSKSADIWLDLVGWFLLAMGGMILISLR